MEQLSLAQILQFVFGGGVLLMLLRVTFMMGQYSSRIESLEMKVNNVETTLAGFMREFAALRAEMVGLQAEFHSFRRQMLGRQS